MTIGCGITGIGYPMTGLGNLGLSATGSFASYDNTALGMNSSLFGMNPMMYGMYNPLYMGKMMAQMETNQVNHASNMHTTLMNNQVQATTETDRAQVSNMITNGSVQQGIMTLRQKVLEGDGQGICLEFDKLKSQIKQTYRDEIAARGAEETPDAAATRILEGLYSQIVSAQVGQTVTLANDINQYCDGAATVGWKTGFHKGHNGMYKDEVLNHCYGTRIDQKASKDGWKTLMNGLGRFGSVVEKGAIGAVVGTGAYGGIWGLGKLFGGLFSKKGSKFADWGFKMSKESFGKTLGWAAVAFMVGDIVWQICDSKDDNKKKS